MEPLWLGAIITILAAAVGYYVGRSEKGMKAVVKAMEDGLQSMQKSIHKGSSPPNDQAQPPETEKRQAET